MMQKSMLICLLSLFIGVNTSWGQDDWDGSLEGFENGWNGWYADPNNGVWEIGDPNSGPFAAHEGTSVACTFLICPISISQYFTRIYKIKGNSKYHKFYIHRLRYGNSV